MFPSCVGRLLSGDSSGVSNSDYMIMLSNHVGGKLHVLENYDNYCCGMSFDSHGQRATGRRMLEKLLEQSLTLLINSYFIIAKTRSAIYDKS